MVHFLHEIEAMIALPDDCYIIKTSEFTGRYDVKGRKVWKHKSDKHPYYLVWDELHGEIEVFHLTSCIHLAVYHPNGDIKDEGNPNRILKFRGGK